jgi:hypothetical protein
LQKLIKKWKKERGNIIMQEEREEISEIVERINDKAETQINIKEEIWSELIY